ncbi:MAG: sigma-70 family RNA polymerase sigma factor [Edaphobacter sp.]
MFLVNPNQTKSVALESIFAAKYDWLLQWALHFAHGDRAAAEDMVQDTFVRFITSAQDVKDAENAEPLLYTYLKFVQLSRQRRERRFPLEELSLIDFDSVQLAIRETSSLDSIELQDTLRRLVFYVVWRKQSSKSASILLLRFLHGYHKEEVMQMTLLSDHRVRNSLMRARDEAKQYLVGDPARLRMMGQQIAPQIVPRNIAVPHDQLLDELRQTVLAARQGDCLPKEELLKPYKSLNPKPISCDLLAHIVSCERCLDIIGKFYGIPPLSGRSHEVIALERRVKPGSKRKDQGGESGLKRTLRLGHERLRDLYDHEPKRLMLVVNGHVIASRDVSAATNKLEVEVSAETRLEFIEVFSEQGICLLAMPVLALPPEAPPQLHQIIDLTRGRSIELLVRFTTGGPLLHVTYLDPFLAMMAVPLLLDEDDSPMELAAGQEPQLVVAEWPGARAGLPSWLTSFIRHLRRSISATHMNALLANAVTFAVLSIICLLIWFVQRPPAITVNALLVRAEAWDAAGPVAGKTGVVRQTVRIRTSKNAIERKIYRDTQRVRVPKPAPLTTAEQKIQQQFAAGGVDWNEPLAASSYQDWHDHQHVRQDQVKNASGSLLVLTTTIPSGPVAQESLTVRTSDFHPVGRTVSLRDSDTIEIAELSFDVLPWGPDTNALFEPLSTVMSLPHPAILPHLPHSLSDVQLDEAELSARLVLNELGADRTERIDLVRIPDGVQVKGIVATEDRKREIETRLRLVPHVLPAIFTFQDLQTGSQPEEPVKSVRQSSVVAELTPLEQYLMQKGMSREDVGRIADQLFANAASINQASRSLEMLTQRFAAQGNLTPAATDALDQLIEKNTRRVLDTVQSEQSLIAQLGLAKTDTVPSANDSSAEPLSEAANRNVALCRELIVNGVASPRDAQTIVTELLQSAAGLHQAALRIQGTLTGTVQQDSQHDNKLSPRIK